MESRTAAELNANPISIDELEPGVVGYDFKVFLDLLKKAKDDSGVTDIRRIACALLNSSGGRILIDNSNPDVTITNTVIEKLKNDMEGQLVTFVPAHIYHRCVTFTGDSLPITMLVKRSSKLITHNSHLYIRGPIGNAVVHDSESIWDVLQVKSASDTDPLQKHAPLTYGSVTKLVEGPRLEFKYWDIHRVQALKFRLKEERTRRTLFAMANLSSGGDLLIGISEDKQTKKNTILGQQITEAMEADLTQFLAEYLTAGEQERIWGRKVGGPQHGKDWEITFLPVLRVPDGKRRRIIRVHLNYCPGGVFEQAPEASYVNEDGMAKNMNFQEWITEIRHSSMKHKTTSEHISCIMRHTRDSADAVADGVHGCPTVSNTGACSGKPNDPTEQNTSMSNQTSCRKKQHRNPFRYKKSPPPVLPVGADPEKLGKVDEHMNKRGGISWVTDKPNWTENIRYESIALKDNIISFTTKCSILTPNKNPINISPSRESIIACGPPRQQMEDFLRVIEENTVGKASAIATDNWLTVLQRNKESRPQHHIMDVCVLNEFGNMAFWAVMTEEFNPGNIRSHLITAARVTRQRMYMTIGWGQCLDITVQCYVYNLSTGITTMLSSTEIEAGKLSSFDFDIIKTAFAGVLLEQSSEISSYVGDHLSVLLTAQQMQTLLETGLDKYNYIEGPPGSGKTFLALFVCSKYDKHDVVVLCTTKPFEAFLRFQNKCETLLAENDEELLRWLTSGELNKYDCVIFDDAHNISCRVSTLRALFGCIAAISSTRLYIFVDNKFQNFKHPTQTKAIRRCLQDFCDDHDEVYLTKTLTANHRNSQSVASFVKACYPSSTTGSTPLTCSKNESGEDVEVAKIQTGVPTRRNSLVQITASLLKQAFTSTSANTYLPQDVAILFDTSNAAIAADRFLSELKEQCPWCPVHKADQFPVAGLTVDTLDNFVGLDRKVCICIPANTAERGLHNDKYKAFIASRGISRVVFVVDTLDHRAVNHMKLDKVPLSDIVPLTRYMEGQNVTFATLAEYETFTLTKSYAILSAEFTDSYAEVYEDIL